MTATAPQARLPLLRLLAFSCGSIPATMLVSMMSMYLPPFYAQKLGVSLAVLGGALATVRLIDLGVDLALGWLMDKTRTPIGRYRPWYIAGLPVFCLGIFKVFNPPADADLLYLSIWFLVLYVAYSMMVLSHAAWGAALSGDYHERSRIFGWMMGLAVVGSVTLSASPILSHGAIKPGDPASMPPLGMMIMLITAVAVPLTLGFMAEPRTPSAAKARPRLADYLAVIGTPSMLRLIVADLLTALAPGIMGPIYLFFFHDAKHFDVGQISLLLIPFTAAGIIASPLWSALGRRFGKHRTLQVACVCYAVCQSILMALPAGLFWPTAAGMFSVGFCGTAFGVLIRSMVADVADEVKLNTGHERSGVLYALITMSQKFSTMMGVSIVYPILQWVGYSPKHGAVNTPQAIFGLEMCYLFAPIGLALLGATLFFGYRLDAARQREIRSQLDEIEARDFMAAQESLTGPGERIAAAS